MKDQLARDEIKELKEQISEINKREVPDLSLRHCSKCGFTTLMHKEFVWPSGTFIPWQFYPSTTEYYRCLNCGTEWKSETKTEDIEVVKDKKTK